MERPVKCGRVFDGFIFCAHSSTNGQRPGQRSSTVDHSDIRGSRQSLAIMVVIRRELPRTRVAGPARKACRIAVHEGSPLPCAIPAADRWCLYRAHRNLARSAAVVSGSASHLLMRALDFDADRPDKPEQLPRNGGDRVLLALAARDQPRVALMQTMLRLPRQ